MDSEDGLFLSEVSSMDVLRVNPRGDVFLTDEFELKLKRFLEIKGLVEIMDKALKEKMKLEMNKFPQMKKFEGRYVKCGVSRPVYKSFVQDPKDLLISTVPENLPKDFSDLLAWIYKFTDFKINSTAVSQYIKETATKVDGKKHYLLPENIKEEELKEDPILTIKIL